MSVTGQEGHQSFQWSDTDEFTAVSDLFAEIRFFKKLERREDERRKMNLS